MIAHPNQGLARTTYLFIDGGCLRAELDKISTHYLGSPGGATVAWDALAADYTKVFDYDALPTRDDGEDDQAYAARNAPIIELHAKLRRLDRFHVHEGDRRRARGRGERAQQKKVDVMITVDMLMHTFRRNMHEATLLASDLDFAPLLQALVQEGMYVTLWYPPAATNAELQAAADSRRELTAQGLASALVDRDNKRLLPSWNSGTVHYRQNPVLQSWDLADGGSLTLSGKPGDHYLAEISNGYGHSQGYAAHHNRKTLLISAIERHPSLADALGSGAYED